MTVYATYFDAHFLIRGAACLRSLLAHMREPVAIRVLALDGVCAAFLPEVIGPLPPGASLHIETLADFEARHPMLTDARADRPLTEYFFTLTPFVCRDALAATSERDWCVYIDADTFFFADPALALADLGHAEIALTEHRFPPDNTHLSRDYGRFNVGWLAFRAGEIARNCLNEWARLCLESCSLVPADGLFGDQKYLDVWPEQFECVAIVAHPGVNTAPWNAAGHTFSRFSESLYVDGQPLVLFHFHRLSRLASGVYETDYRDYGSLSAPLRAYVYPPYIAALENLWQRHGASLPPAIQSRRPAGGRLRQAVRHILAALRLFSRRRVLFVNGRALSPLRGLAYG